MSIDARTLIQTQSLSDSVAAYYTAPEETYTIIDKATAVNITGSQCQIWVHVLAESESADTYNTVIYSLNIGAGEAIHLDILKNHIVSPGGQICARASAADSVNIRASGREVT